MEENKKVTFEDVLEACRECYKANWGSARCEYCQACAVLLKKTDKAEENKHGI